MLLFYVRHGDPIYSPNSLTPFGERQAEAVGRMLSHYRIGEVYSSTSERAKLTAKPLCEITKKEMKLLDFANEDYVWRDLVCYSEAMGRTTWLFQDPKTKELFHTPEIRELGQRWYEHPDFKGENYLNKDYKAGIERVQTESDKFLESLGYKRVADGKYEVVSDNNNRVALFAHQGFGIAFLSCVLGIPYPMFASHFDIFTSGVSVIEFSNVNGYAYPKVLEHSSSAHLYKEGLPTRYT
ncbi:MAG: histidine phosphatase family protein [Clostridia bacterium]|nr:histidine phosphatase family protein [Clostridia bacterium]